MFGDTLPGLAAAVPGGLGLAGSASLGDSGPGLFEPVHRSGPPVARQGSANPARRVRSNPLLLRPGLERPDDAATLERAIDEALVTAPTADLGGAATTRELGDAVLRGLD